MKIGSAGLEALDIMGLKWVCRTLGWDGITAYASLAELMAHEAEEDILLVAAPDAAIDHDMVSRASERLMLFDTRPCVLPSSIRVISRSMPEEEIASRLTDMERRLRAASPGDGRQTLSSRETEVLREVAAGKTNKEIAEALCISVNTVITHRKNISSKLGIRSASGLSLYALMHGLVKGVSPHDISGK